jgi:hypothetical protein
MIWRVVQVSKCRISCVEQLQEASSAVHSTNRADNAFKDTAARAQYKAEAAQPAAVHKPAV